MFLGVAKLYYGTENINGQNVVGDMVVFSSLSFLRPHGRRAKGFISVSWACGPSWAARGAVFVLNKRTDRRFYKSYSTV